MNGAARNHRREGAPIAAGRDDVHQEGPSGSWPLGTGSRESSSPRSLETPPQLFAAVHDAAAGNRLTAIARDFSPRIQRWPGGSVVLDVAGLQRLLGDAAAIAGHLVRAGAPRVALARSQMAALILARAYPGTTVSIGDPGTAVRDVPLAVLQQLLADLEPSNPLLQQGARGSDPAAIFDVLARWGLTTLGELAALPPADLSARLGDRGVAMQRLARGMDLQPLVPDPEVPRFVGSFELEWPLDTLEPLSFVFARLLDPLSAALERADRGAVAMHLTLRLTDRTSHVRSLQLPAAMRDPRVLRTLLLLDLESHPPPAAVDVVSLELDPAPARIVQYSLLERAVPSPETLATLMARLGALVGEARCGSPVLVDTHRPDGFEMTALTVHETRRTNSSCRLPAPKASPSRELVTSRREISELLAADPDAAKQRLAPILRRFRPPVAIRVAVEGGRPARVAIDRQGMPGGAVQQCAGPWRTSGAWWQAASWNRDEWDVALSDGAVCRLFRDRDGDQWFMEGVVD